VVDVLFGESAAMLDSEASAMNIGIKCPSRWRSPVSAGCHGARLVGAGFGGCVVALCQPKTRLKLPVLWRGRPAGGAWGSVS